MQCIDDSRGSNGCPDSSRLLAFIQTVRIVCHDPRDWILRGFSPEPTTTSLDELSIVALSLYTIPRVSFKSWLHSHDS
jgi:hypothetical protein